MTTSHVRIFQVDAFTDRPFGGNPAAVCLLDAPADQAWMQAVAQEMNLSETAFVWPMGPAAYSLRWFTPMVEVKLCGHATLASAHTLWATGTDAAGELTFHTRSGALHAFRVDEGARPGTWIELDFPSFHVEPAPLPADIAQAFAVEPVFVGLVTGGETTYLIEVAAEDTVRALTPELSGLRRAGAPFVLVTARARSSDHQVVSRFFAPSAGVDEDPVTGSAHCYMARHWAERLGTTVFTAYQASRRGGLVRVRLEGERVRLGGQAVTVLQGMLLA